MSVEPHVQLMVREGCHLCQAAREVVRGECGEGNWTETDVDSDAELQRQYGELVPVVLVDGRQVGYYRIDPARLRAAIEGAGDGKPAPRRRWWQRGAGR